MTTKEKFLHDVKILTRFERQIKRTCDKEELKETIKEYLKEYNELYYLTIKLYDYNLINDEELKEMRDKMHEVKNNIKNEYRKALKKCIL